MTNHPAPRSGLTHDGEDSTTAPSHDLFRHVNGQWLNTHVIPADRAVDGAFHQLRDDAEEKVRDIIESAPASSRIGSFYQSFMDTTRLNAAGTEPLADDLALLTPVTDHHSLALALADLQRVGAGGLLDAFVDQDPKNSHRYVVLLNQSGLTLPDEAYYRAEQHRETLAALRPHIADMFTLTALLPTLPLTQHLTPAEAADRIISFETQLAAHHVDAVANRDADKRYNPTTLVDMSCNIRYAGFPIHDWFRRLAAPYASGYDDTIILRQPDFLAGASALWLATPLDTLAVWALWHLLNSRTSLLTEEISLASFRFFGTVLSGTEEERDRWKRGVALTSSLLGEDIGRVYVERHFPPSHKERITLLVHNLLDAYQASISHLEWMSPTTREKALAKLEKFTIKVGYPDKWRDYSSVTLTPTDLLGNYRVMACFLGDYEWQKLGKPVDRTEWFMNPQTVNAYFNPVMNEIVFPAAILQPPFFDADADDAANYGGIGAVIGHEIGHGFDDQGSKYDGDGTLNNWWTDADRAAFTARTSALIAQYDALTPTGLAPTVHHVNGNLTLGENIGDLGGLSISLLAYNMSLASQGISSVDDAPILDGMTGLQRVFYNWARVWRTAIRPEQAIMYLSVDPHSPAEFRCNQIVRNIPEFYTAFSVTEADAMWLPEDQRVRIWS